MSPTPGHLGDHQLRRGNAIAVPLTGWLSQRFGQVRLFVVAACCSVVRLILDCCAAMVIMTVFSKGLVQQAR